MGAQTLLFLGFEAEMCFNSKLMSSVISWVILVLFVSPHRALSTGVLIFVKFKKIDSLGYCSSREVRNLVIALPLRIQGYRSKRLAQASRTVPESWRKTHLVPSCRPVFDDQFLIGKDMFLIGL